MRRFLWENSLGLAFLTLFGLAVVGQAFAGRADFNNQLAAEDLQQVTLGEYMTSSDFAVDVMENWQSEYLQFFLYVFLTVWLVQRGSPESKSLHKSGVESDEEQRVGPHASPESPAGRRPAASASSCTPVRSAMSWEPSSCCPGSPSRSPVCPRTTRSG